MQASISYKSNRVYEILFTLVTEQNSVGTNIGYSNVFHRMNGSVHIQCFHIYPTFRCQGYGKAYVTIVLDIIKRFFNVNKVDLQSSGVDVFWRRCGFQSNGIKSDGLTPMCIYLKNVNPKITPKALLQRLKD